MSVFSRVRTPASITIRVPDSVVAGEALTLSAAGSFLTDAEVRGVSAAVECIVRRAYRET